MINLFYLSPNNTGGWVTFTVHLYLTLTMKEEVNLYKIGNRTERNKRNFGYGIEYRNISIEDAMKMRGPLLITAMGKKFVEPAVRLLKKKNARIVIHDPTELWEGIKNVKNPIVIRKNNLKYFDNAVFIPHPYVRQCDDKYGERKVRAISTSRIDFDKHTELLLDANRLLKKKDKIQIRGFENRLYTKFKIMPKYPEWVQSVAAYPREIDAAVNLLKTAKFMVDMSAIKGDGGGTQYTFLEAMDAGTVCILNTEWMNVKGPMIKDLNCLVADNGESLAVLIANTSQTLINRIRRNGYKMLEAHNPKKIARKYLKELL